MRSAKTIPLLERIVFRWKHAALPPKHVNPLYISKLDQIHPVRWHREAIPSDRDLI